MSAKYEKDRERLAEKDAEIARLKVVIAELADALESEEPDLFTWGPLVQRGREAVK
jgi:hypothetical protein